MGLSVLDVFDPEHATRCPTPEQSDKLDANACTNNLTDICDSVCYEFLEENDI